METMKDEYTDMWKRRFEAQEESMDEIRSIKHDMQAHLIVLQYYLEEAKYEEAKQYLQTMRNNVYTKSMESDIKIEIGNPLVNAILKDYLRKSKDEIHFYSQGELPEKTIVTDYDWCTIFSNLMSNAVEACGNLHSTEKEINLEVSVGEEYISIVMNNPVEWIIEKEVLEGGTTKENKISHGFGLKNVRTVVERYKGSLEYTCMKTKFEVRIMLPKEHME